MLLHQHPDERPYAQSKDHQPRIKDDLVMLCADQDTESQGEEGCGEQGLFILEIAECQQDPGGVHQGAHLEHMSFQPERLQVRP